MEVTYQGNAYVHGWTVVGQRICTGRTVVGQRRSSYRGAIAEDAVVEELLQGLIAGEQAVSKKALVMTD